MNDKIIDLFFVSFIILSFLLHHSFFSSSSSFFLFFFLMNNCNHCGISYDQLANLHDLILLKQVSVNLVFLLARYVHHSVVCYRKMPWPFTHLKCQLLTQLVLLVPKHHYLVIPSQSDIHIISPVTYLWREVLWVAWDPVCHHQLQSPLLIR